MPATTELKLFSNCWHLLFSNIFCSLSSFQFLWESERNFYNLQSMQCPVSRAFHFYHEFAEDWRNFYFVAMPSLLGFSFLRYPLKTIVKSIVSSIIFASNSQNILKFIIFLPVLGFPVFLLT